MSSCVKTPTEHFLPPFSISTPIGEEQKMGSCEKCGGLKLNASPICGRCVGPAEYEKQMKALAPVSEAWRMEERTTYVDLSEFQDEAPLTKSVDVSAFTSGWAAGLMMSQMEYASRMTYRKPKTRVLDVSNARTFRPHHCVTCERTRHGNV
jgi:hypothetical protein